MIGIFWILSMTLVILRCKGVTKTVLTDDTGTFSSPNFPNKYSDWEENRWTIQVTPPNVIKLVFPAFHLELIEDGCNSCDCDYVTVDDPQGPIDASAQVALAGVTERIRISEYGRVSSYQQLMSPTGTCFQTFSEEIYCGKSIPSSFVSCGSSLVVYFKSDNVGTYPGFNATYAAHSPGPKQQNGECTAIEDVTTSSNTADGSGMVKERFRRRNESRNTTNVSDQLNNMSRIRCATWCLRSANCVGFIYYRADLLCKLLKMVQSAENDRCAESNTFVCFEKV